jgi:phosphoglycolate phosphatase
MKRGIAALVLFDLDGTLVDSAPDLCAAANHLRALARLEPIALEVLRPAVSRGSRAMLSKAFPDLGQEPRDALVAPFLSRYAQHIAEHGGLFESVPAVLQRIESVGSQWGVVTNKPEALARSLIQHLNLAHRCAVLIGGDTLPQRKPEPEPLLHACRLLAVDPQQCVYVGDDQRDIQAARAAGIRSVAAAWGYRDAEERIEQWGADHVAQDPQDLLREGALAGIA